jgi:hypothetical protein
MNMHSGSIIGNKADHEVPSIDRNAPGVTTRRISGPHKDYGAILVTAPDAEDHIFGTDTPPKTSKNPVRILKAINERARRRTPPELSSLNCTSKESMKSNPASPQPPLGGAEELLASSNSKNSSNVSTKTAIALHNSTLAMLEGTHVNAQPADGSNIKIFAETDSPHTSDDEGNHHRSRSESLAKLEGKVAPPTVDMSSSDFIRFANGFCAFDASGSPVSFRDFFSRTNEKKARASDSVSQGNVTISDGETSPAPIHATQYTPSVYNTTPTVTKGASDCPAGPASIVKSEAGEEPPSAPVRSALERAESYMNIVTGPLARLEEQHNEQKSMPANSLEPLSEGDTPASLINNVEAKDISRPNRTSSLHMRPMRQPAPPPGLAKPAAGPSTLRHAHSAESLSERYKVPSGKVNNSPSFVDSPSLQMLENAISPVAKPENHVFTSVGPSVTNARRIRDTMGFFKVSSSFASRVYPNTVLGGPSLVLMSSLRLGHLQSGPEPRMRHHLKPHCPLRF